MGVMRSLEGEAGEIQRWRLLFLPIAISFASVPVGVFLGFTRWGDLFAGLAGSLDDANAWPWFRAGLALSSLTVTSPFLFEWVLAGPYGSQYDRTASHLGGSLILTSVVGVVSLSGEPRSDFEYRFGIAGLVVWFGQLFAWSRINWLIKWSNAGSRAACARESEW